MYSEGNLIEEALRLLNESNDSNYKIAKKTGMSESTIGNYKRGKTKPTPANATLLLQYFDGSMSDISGGGKFVETTDFMQIPLVPISARAGYLNAYGDCEYIGSLPTVPVIVDKHYKGKYRVFEIEGDSMDNGTRNAIYDKDKILCREVKADLWCYKLHIKDWFFVIVHRTEGIVVKQIVKHDTDRGEIHCHSLNPLFSDFVLNLNDVLELYNVVKIVDRNTRI